ncbi:39239_t:CDS:2, partial [Gigaspora margarita]
MIPENRYAYFNNLIELKSLNNEISKLEEIYLTNDDLDEESDNESTDNETYNETSESLVIYINNFFTVKQIEYLCAPSNACIAEAKKTHNKRLNKRDDDAFLAALKRFQKMKALTQSKSSLYFLGIIDTSMHATEFKDGTPKAYLTTNINLGV